MTSSRASERGCTLLELMCMLGVLAVVMAIVIAPRACRMLAAPKVHVIESAVAGAIRGVTSAE